jgi:hypothetical protein
MLGLVLNGLEALANLVTQMLEPFAGFGLFLFYVVGQSDRQAWGVA